MGAGLWEMTDAAREGHWRGHMSSRGRACCLRRGPRGPSHTTWRDETGNVANLDLVDSAHLSVWLEAHPGSVLANLADLHEQKHSSAFGNSESYLLIWIHDPLLLSEKCCDALWILKSFHPPFLVVCSVICLVIFAKWTGMSTTYKTNIYRKI